MQPKLFFVLGVPKSGTTWLQHLLNAHPNISCRGEGKFHAYGSALRKLNNEFNKVLEKGRSSIGVDFPPVSDSEFMHQLREFMAMRIRGNPSPGKTNLQWIGEKDPDHTFHTKWL